MTTKIKTTVTFTLSFISDDQSSAISHLIGWMHEYQEEHPTVNRNCESGEYTIIDNSRSISNSFKFSNVAELAQKYGTFFSAYELARGVLDYGKSESVTATSETFEVKEDK